MVPVREQSHRNQPYGTVRVCGDYSVFINGQLEMHRQPMPLLEDLMRRLDGTHYFSKVDLTNAYKLQPDRARTRKPETSRPEHTQMGPSSDAASIRHQLCYRVLTRCHDQLTSNLPGVAVYLDDMLISGKTAEDHLNNLRRLLKRLNDRGLRCRIQKCVFAQDSVTYLGDQVTPYHVMASLKSKGRKADAVTKMPVPSQTSHSYAISLVLCSSTKSTSSCLTCPPSQSCCTFLTEKHTK